MTNTPNLGATYTNVRLAIKEDGIRADEFWRLFSSKQEEKMKLRKNAVHI